jgi:hypothetical protein
MKTLLLVLPLLTLIEACDAPQRIRRPDSTFESGLDTTNGSGVGFTNSGSTGGATTGTSTGGTTAGTTTGTTTGGGSTSTINCIKTVTAYHAGLGNVEVCQDTNNEVRFKMTFSTTDQNDGTCIVPMFKNGSNLSTYLGNAQCTKHNQGQSMEGTVSKNRTGHSGYQINSVMVLKYSGTNAFFQCMNAYGQAYTSCLAGYGNNPFYKSYCESQGTTYMNNLCNSFKSNYPHSQVSTR